MTKHVVISGGGPAGLYAAIVLMSRNTSTEKKYTVELVDAGDDYGTNEIKPKRSWMIGLSAHGIGALKKVPGLYEDYVSKVGVLIKSATIHVNKTSISFDTTEMGDSYNVDRNFVVAELSRYLHDKFGKDPALTMRWNTKVLFIDGEKHEVLGRNTKTGKDVRMKYDLLLGCDGSRSSTRAAFHAAHRDFEFTYTSTVGGGKGAHVDFPKGYDHESMHIVIEPIPGGSSFCLAEQGGKMNFNIGYDGIRGFDADLASKDPVVVSNYLRKQMMKTCPDFAKALDIDEIGRQFVEQEFSSIYQVHCNFYHSLRLKALLCGDAAHGTLPTLGQGMNQAFVDVKVLNELLDECGDENWETLMPIYSQRRVKEGNALTFLSYYWLSKNSTQQFYYTTVNTIRTMLNKIFPWIEEDPMVQVGKGGSFTKAYRSLKKRGYIDNVRRVNDGQYIEHFEREIGLVEATPKRTLSWMPILFVAIAMSSLACYWFGLMNPEASPIDEVVVEPQPFARFVQPIARMLRR